MKSIAVLVLILCASVARAEDIATYEADGEGDVAGTDPRVVALDDAFAHAIAQALSDLLPGDTRTAHKQELDREIIGHARLWVVRFSVTKDTTADDRRQLTVTVRVDRDKMRDRITELKITAGDAAPAAGARTVAPLVRLATPAGVRADYGASADLEVPGLAALTTALRGAGMTVKRAPASGNATADLDDAAAATLATEAKAELAAIAAVVVGPTTPVRGVAAPAALVTAHVRIIDKSHVVVGEGSAAIAAQATPETTLEQAIARAIDRALVVAMLDVAPAAPRQLTTGHPAVLGSDTPLAAQGVVLVRLSPKTTFQQVLAEQKHLAGAKGVSKVGMRRLSPAGWVLGVTTDLPIERVAAIAKQPPAADTAASVRVVGEVVELTLAGSP